MKNDVLEKKLNVSDYLSYYGALLTPHQAEMLREYYDCDISLFEIASEYGISRQAVRDAIVRGERSLLEFEGKLKFKQRDDKLKARLRDISASASCGEETRSKLTALILEMEE
jgi:Uncharacterized protein conserved in bacteria